MKLIDILINPKEKASDEEKKIKDAPLNKPHLKEFKISKDTTVKIGSKDGITLKEELGL